MDRVIKLKMGALHGKPGISKWREEAGMVGTDYIHRHLAVNRGMSYTIPKEYAFPQNSELAILASLNEGYRLIHVQVTKSQDGVLFLGDWEFVPHHSSKDVMDKFAGGLVCTLRRLIFLIQKYPAAKLILQFMFPNYSQHLTRLIQSTPLATDYIECVYSTFGNTGVSPFILPATLVDFQYAHQVYRTPSVPYYYLYEYHECMFQEDTQRDLLRYHNLSRVAIYNVPSSVRKRALEMAWEMKLAFIIGEEYTF